MEPLVQLPMLPMPAYMTQILNCLEIDKEALSPGTTGGAVGLADRV